MNKNALALLGAAVMQAAMYEDGMRRVYEDGSVSRHSINMPKINESKPLREYTYKGHTIMAYSKDDARNRLRKEGKI